MNEFWEAVEGAALQQGDHLPRCLVPMVPEDFGQNDIEYAVELQIVDLIVLSQSCDLERNGLPFVALCPIVPLEEFRRTRAGGVAASMLNDIKKGRQYTYHMLGSQGDARDSQSVYVVNFAHVVSLRKSYVSTHAAGIGNRARLKPPYLEHFSQAFARMYMRVGLPLNLPDF